MPGTLKEGTQTYGSALGDSGRFAKHILCEGLVCVQVPIALRAVHVQDLVVTHGDMKARKH